MNSIPALLNPAPVTSASMPDSTAPDKHDAASFDAVLMREREVRHSAVESAPGLANPVPPADVTPSIPIAHSKTDADTGTVPDAAPVSENLQAFIASLIVQTTQKARDPGADTITLQTATDKPDQPPGVSAQPDARAMLAADTAASDVAQPADQPRIKVVAQTDGQALAKFSPQKLSGSTLSAATDTLTPQAQAAPVQTAPALVTSPVSTPLAPQENTAPPTLHLAPRLASPGWDQALGQRVLWLAGSGNQQASLTINPPQLGPVQVTLQLQDNQAIASFVSAQPEVRQALEAALPKLREMMHEAGLQLSHTQVEAGGTGHGERGRNFAQPSPAASRFGTSDSGPDANETVQAVPATAGLGLVDTFA